MKRALIILGIVVVMLALSLLRAHRSMWLAETTGTVMLYIVYRSAKESCARNPRRAVRADPAAAAAKGDDCGNHRASLLPIMWSTRTGAEVMKPLATPVICGMLSSLLHILIVRP